MLASVKVPTTEALNDRLNVMMPGAEEAKAREDFKASIQESMLPVRHLQCIFISLPLFIIFPGMSSLSYVLAPLPLSSCTCM